MLGMLRGRSVRAPWPFDISLNGTGMMLLHDPRYQQEGLASEHPDPLAAAAPTEMAYSAQNPMVEATTVYDDLVYGMGQRIQQSNHDRRYRFASKADCSVQGQVVLGPLLTTVTPNGNLDTTNGHIRFFEIGGSLYTLNGRYALKRTADSAAGWGTTSRDFGVGKAAVDVVVFADNNTGATLAYVGMGDSELMYKFDGTTWTQHASLYARALCVAGANLYRASGTNLVAKVDLNSDPWTAGNWSATNQFRVGDQTSGITRMLTNAAGILVIFKTDGIYVLDQDGNDQQLYSDLKFAPDANNGKYSFKYENDIITTYNGRTFAIGPDLGIRQIGPERVLDDTGPVTGYVTAGVGTPFAAYAGLYNPDSGHSYLLKYGGWAETPDGEAKQLDVWHGSLSRTETSAFTPYDGTTTAEFASRKITAAYRTSIGADSGHERVYLGHSDGTVTWFQLPCTPNPTACSNYDFANTTTSGYVALPLWNGTFPKDEKVLRAATTTGQFSSSNGLIADSLVIGHGDNSTWTTYPTSGSLASQSPGARAPVGTARTLADFYLSLAYQNIGAATTNDTPIVNSFSVHYRVNPPIQEVFDLYILCENGLAKRDGSRFSIGADQIRSAIRTAVATTAGVTLILPDERSLTVQLANFGERQMYDERFKTWRAVVHVRAIQSDVDLGGGVVALA